MNKADLISAAAQAAGINKKQAALAVEAALQAICKELQMGGKVHIASFGTFEVRQRRSYTGTDPHTRKSREIPASVLPAFRPAQSLRAKLNEREKSNETG